jgi:hypothetical protein
VTIDFWDVLDLRGSPFDLVPVLEQVAKLAPTDRMRNRGAHIDYLADATRRGSSVSGTIERVRTRNWPGRTHLLTGDRRALDIPANWAPSEQMSFQFHRTLRTLAVQRHQYFRANTLARLIQEITGVSLTLQPKLRRDAWERFNRITRFGVVELRVGHPLGPNERFQVVPFSLPRLRLAHCNFTC